MKEIVVAVASTISGEKMKEYAGEENVKLATGASLIGVAFTTLLGVGALGYGMVRDVMTEKKKRENAVEDAIEELELAEESI